MLCLEKSKPEDANQEAVCGLSAGHCNSNGQAQGQRLAGPTTRSQSMSASHSQEFVTNKQFRARPAELYKSSWRSFNTN